MLSSLILRSQLCTCVLFLTGTVPLLIAQDRAAVLQTAVSQLKSGHAEAAVRILQPLIDSHPDDLQGCTLMGMAMTASGNVEKADPFFERALRLRPMYPPALRGLAMNELTLKHHKAAKTHFEQLLTVVPGDIAAQAGLGEIAFAQGNFAVALQHLKQTGALYQENPRLLLDQAKANMELKQPGGAIALLDQMPDAVDAEAHFEAGALLAFLKDYKSAARQFELAFPKYTDRYSAGFNLALARVNAQDYAGALRAGERLIADGYRKAELYNLLAEAYEKTGDTRHAYDFLRTATQIEPSDETNYIDLITLCLDHKNYDLALEIAQIGIARLPASERLHLQLGVVFAMKEQLGKARKEFEIAGKLAPDRSLPHVALGLVMLQMNRPDEAIEELRRRVHEVPGDYMALWFLGEALNRSGVAPDSPGLKEAIEALQHSVRINPEISQSQELLGKLLAHDGRLDEAAVHLELATSLDPDNLGAIYQLAQVYSRKGDTARAKPLFAKVSKIKTEDREKFSNRQFQQILRAGSQ